METDKLHDLSFTELIGVKASQINREDSLFMTNVIDRIIRGRINNFRAYIDRYDQLTPEQKEFTRPCMSYRMQMGSQNYIPRIDCETSLTEDGHNTRLAHIIAQTALGRVVEGSIQPIDIHTEEEQCSKAWRMTAQRGIEEAKAAGSEV